MATGYGGWVGGDDWRAVVEATVANTNGSTCTVTVRGKLQSVYASGSYWSGNATSSSSGGTTSNGQFSCSAGQTVTFKTNTFTVSRTTSAQTVTCRATVYGSGSYSGSSSTATVAVTIPAKPSYEVSYNANGGTGAPASQTKWYGAALALSSTKPTRAAATVATYTVTYSAAGGSVSTASATATRKTTYTFKNWNTVQGGTGASYASGASYTANESATLYAQWNATTATSSIVLPKPTRANYTFDGWYSGSTKVGNAGASYTPTATVTLTARWTLDYAPPSLGTLTAVRCTSNGTQSDDGTYCKVTLAFTQGSVAASSHAYSLSAKAVNGSSTYTGSASTSSVSATSLTVTLGGGNLDTEKRYTVTATLSDGTGTVSKMTVLTPSFFTLDLLKGGKGVAIGQAATKANVLDVAMDTYMEGKSLSIISTNIADGTVPASDANGNSYLYFRGSDNKSLGFINPTVQASGTQRMRFYARRTIGGTDHYNGFFIGIDSSGNPAVGFHNAAAKTAWQDALSIGAIGLKDSLAAADIPSLAASKITSGTLGIARGGTGSTAVTSILANTTRTVLAWGPLVMVQLHGATGKPGSGTVLNSGTLSSYKPNPAYNASAIVGDTSGHIARLWVDASTGNICLASMGYETSSAWYGTLVYMRK